MAASEQTPLDENSNKTAMNNEESHSNTASSTTTVTVTANGTMSQPSTLASFLDQLINESQHKPSADLDPVRSWEHFLTTL